MALCRLKPAHRSQQKTSGDDEQVHEGERSPFPLILYQLYGCRALALMHDYAGILKCCWYKEHSLLSNRWSAPQLTLVEYSWITVERLYCCGARISVVGDPFLREQPAAFSPLTHFSWDEYVLHRDWSSDCCSFHIRQHTGLLGCRHQHHVEERHQLFLGVPGCGGYSRRLSRHPLCHNHQHRHWSGLLRMPLPGLFCLGTDTELHFQPSCHCNWQISGCQNSSEVSVSLALILNLGCFSKCCKILISKDH